MKNIFRFILIVSFTFSLIACGRVGPLIPYEGYVPTFDTFDTNNFNKDDLEKLSDSDLIFKAMDLGLYNQIVFSGDDALDPDIPSYQKDLANRSELIEVILKSIDSVEPDLIDSISNEQASLKMLSDANLIFKAIDLGLYNKIVFSGDDALDPDTPSYKKELGNREELIKILLEAIEGNKVTLE